MKHLINNTSKFLMIALCTLSASPALCTDHSGGAGADRPWTYEEYKEAIEIEAMQGTLQELFDKRKGDLSTADHIELSRAVIGLTAQERDLRITIVRRAEAEIAAKYLLSTNNPKAKEMAATLRSGPR